MLKSLFKIYFLDCPFSSQSWSSLPRPLNFKIERNSSMYPTIFKWKESYPCSKKGPSAQKIIWNTLQFVLVWNVFLMKNGLIFQKKAPCIRKFLRKTRALTIETIYAKGNSHIIIKDLQAKEWIIFRSALDLPSRHNKPSIRKLSTNAQWKVRLKEQEFIEWIDGKWKPRLFFDGASKFNPRTIGVGGEIFYELGSNIATYQWGLSKASNNKGEA